MSPPADEPSALSFLLAPLPSGSTLLADGAARRKTSAVAAGLLGAGAGGGVCLAAGAAGFAADCAGAAGFVWACKLLPTVASRIPVMNVMARRMARSSPPTISSPAG